MLRGLGLEVGGHEARDAVEVGVENGVLSWMGAGLGRGWVGA